MPNKTPRIIIGGMVYRLAEEKSIEKQTFDTYMGQYEEVTRTLNKLLADKWKNVVVNAQKATMGYNFDQSNKKLSELAEVIDTAILEDLGKLNESMASLAPMIEAQKAN